MAGKIIADIIEAPAGRISLNVANVTVASINASGLYTSTGNLIISQANQIGTAAIVDGAVATAKIEDGAVTQAKLASNIAGTGPAFSVTTSGNQNLSDGVYTKVQFPTELFDTANCFDNTTNYRFTPNVAGYYLFSLNLRPYSTNTGLSSGNVLLYKNGSVIARSSTGNFSSGNALGLSGTVSLLVYMNGTTDYVEGYAMATGTQLILENASNGNTFSGFLARAA
jgi:hypothetical protein